MKVLKTIGGIVVWVIVSTILSILGSKVLNWLAGAFHTESTFGSIVFLIITMPIVFSIVYYACLMIGVYFADGKTPALIILLVCGVWQILTLLYSLTSITTWVVSIATVLGFLFVYLGKLGESKDNGNS